MDSWKNDSVAAMIEAGVDPNLEPGQASCTSHLHLTPRFTLSSPPPTSCILQEHHWFLFKCTEM